MTDADWIGFGLAVLLIELTPGPNMAWLAALAMGEGRRAGLAATAGVAIGLFVNALAAALGIAFIVSASPLLWQVLRWGGAAFLLPKQQRAADAAEPSLRAGGSSIPRQVTFTFDGKCGVFDACGGDNVAALTAALRAMAVDHTTQVACRLEADGAAQTAALAFRFHCLLHDPRLRITSADLDRLGKCDESRHVCEIHCAALYTLHGRNLSTQTAGIKENLATMHLK